MNWDAIGAVGELIGALAVVATIVYLARQVRDNSVQVKLNTTQSYASLLQDAYSSVYTNEQTIRAWIEGRKDPDTLEPDERELFFFLMDRQMNNAIPLINHYKEGAISRQEFDHYKDYFLNLASTRGGTVWLREGSLNSIMRTVVDDLKRT